MAIIRVNSTTQTLAAATSSTVTLGWTTGAGNCLLVIVTARSTTAAHTVTGTGATFTQAFITASSSGTARTSYNYALNMTGGATTVTVGSGSTSVVKAVTVIEYSGVATASATDGATATQGAAATSQNGQTLTTTNDVDVIIQSASSSANTGTTYSTAGPAIVASTSGAWSSVGNIGNNGSTNGSIGHAVAECLAPITGTYQANWTSVSSAYIGAGIALKAAATTPLELNGTTFKTDSNLEAYYRMESNSNDATSNGNNGTDTSVTYAAAKFGSGATYSSTAKTSVNASTSLDGFFDSGGTIVGWINPTTQGGLNAGRLADKTNGTSAGYYWAWDTGSSTAFKLHFAHYFSAGSGSVEYSMTGAMLSAASKWIHVAVTYNNTSASNAPIIYVNGVQVPLTQTLTASGTRVSDATLPLGIGGRPDTTLVGLSGAVDDLAFFNRTLSATEIRALYEGTSPAPTITVKQLAALGVG